MSRLQQWSRKKRGVAVEDDAERIAPTPHPEEMDAGYSLEDAVADANPQVAEEDKQLPVPGSLDHTLPDPDTLLPGSDFSVFMASGVSASLRRRALRRLWATGNYNVRDGLDDYDADYRQQLKPMSSELVGKLRRWVDTLENEQAQPTAPPTAEEHAESEPDQPGTHLSHSNDTGVSHQERPDFAQHGKIDERIKSR